MKGCRAITEKEESQVMEGFRGSNAVRDKTLFTVGIYTGLRIGSNLSIRVSDVWQNGKIVDSLTISRRFLKGKKESVCIALHQRAKEAIKERLNEMEKRGWLKPEMFLYRSQRGGNKPLSRTGAWVVFKKTFKMQSMTGKLATHSTRKTFCKRVHEKLNFDLIKTCRAMNHRNIQSTISYLSFEQPEITDAILSI